MDVIACIENVLDAKAVTFDSRFPRYDEQVRRFRHEVAVEIAGVLAADDRGAVDALHAIREQFANGRGGYDDDPVVRIADTILERP
jgi:tetrahydromethanopterin S-methyltransferase subunit A